MELAPDTGNGRKMTEFTMANKALLAAMQTEKVRSTVRAKPLPRHKERTPYFRSSRNASMICGPPLRRLSSYNLGVREQR